MLTVFSFCLCFNLQSCSGTKGGGDLEKLHVRHRRTVRSAPGQPEQLGKAVAAETCFNLFSLRLEVALVMEAGPTPLDQVA